MMEQKSDHPGAPAALAALLRAALPGCPAVLDARAEGIEQVVLFLADEAGGHPELHLLLLDAEPRFWLDPAGSRPAASTGFGDWLRRHLSGARIARVSAGSSGRVLRLDLAFTGGPGEGAIAALVLDPGPSACRLLVLDAQGHIAQRYPPTAHAGPSGRGTPGKLYEEPGGRRALHAAEDVQPPAAFAAVREASLARIRLARAEECVRRVRRILRTQAQRLERLEASLTRELAEAREGTQWRRQAEALLAHARRVPRGARQVTLEDPSHPGHTLAIDLDPKLGVGPNAKRLFQKAARLERSLPLREQKSASCSALLGAVRGWLASPALAEPQAARVDLDREAGARVAAADAPGDSPGSIDTVAALRAAWQDARRRSEAVEPALRRRWQQSLEQWREALAALDRPMDRAGYASRKAESVRPEPGALADPGSIHPRRFLLPGGWEVLVGRSNRENDALTHKLARPDDLWFHARGVTGSHVILRCAGRGASPGKAIIEQAAAIAAFFSKSRTSALAPVAYTEKRYVRKPRKGAPGLALCLREKVLMVRPALPPASVSEQ